MKQNKYNYYHVLQGDYGYGWDDVCFYDSNDKEQMKALVRDIKTYRESEPKFAHRVIQRREPNPRYNN